MDTQRPSHRVLLASLVAALATITPPASSQGEWGGGEETTECRCQARFFGGLSYADCVDSAGWSVTYFDHGECLAPEVGCVTPKPCTFIGRIYVHLEDESCGVIIERNGTQIYSGESVVMSTSASLECGGGLNYEAIVDGQSVVRLRFRCGTC